jgi:hypothetical protein
MSVNKRILLVLSLPVLAGGLIAGCNNTDDDVPVTPVPVVSVSPSPVYVPSASPYASTSVDVVPSASVSVSVSPSEKTSVRRRNLS